MTNLASDLFPHPSSEFSIDGHTLRYIDTAAEAKFAGSEVEKPDSGAEKQSDLPTFVCVHGNPTWSFYYRRIIERYGKQQRVIAVDHIGCGRSDKPSAEDFPYTMAAHRDNLIRLVDELDLKNVILIAHDWGGAIGLSAMHARRERLAGIGLLNTAAFPPPYMPQRIAACRMPLLGTPAVRGLNLFARAAITMAMSRTKMKPDVAAGLLAPYDSWKNRVAIDRFVRDIPLNDSHPTMKTLRQLESDLPDLASLPISLIWGMKDWCFRPECLRRFEAVWPDAEVTELATTGHYVIEDSPEETLQAIDSLLSRVKERIGAA
ncbi:Haloalkane dehalogenase-like protein [Rhodopirellula islandica]|uniref:Haloalkane dehalogenase-like protein n=1 Tax=Rhodopirellula islandica TaxID=595434 RepID=A0A0J1EAC5_RHOIS|nr:alpha/beta fold hydrolase [Rhodopirellula islandica]KLU02449.1 Haloalkane dehalogenase-like protein [Rhodopirellula islandica]